MPSLLQRGGTNSQRDPTVEERISFGSLVVHLNHRAEVILSLSPLPSSLHQTLFGKFPAHQSKRHFYFREISQPQDLIPLKQRTLSTNKQQQRKRAARERLFPLPFILSRMKQKSGRFTKDFQPNGASGMHRPGSNRGFHSRFKRH